MISSIETLYELFCLLNGEQKIVISLYYFADFSEREIGEILGQTRDRVHRIHRTALDKMRVASMRAA